MAIKNLIQVTVTDHQDYIKEYRNFYLDPISLEMMGRYISQQLLKEPNTRLIIKRWPHQN